MMSSINGVHSFSGKGLQVSVSGGEGAEWEKWWGLNGTAGIMIGLWDLTTAANNCQESMNVIYSKLDVEGVDRSQCGRNVWCEVGVVQQYMSLLYMVNHQAGLRGGLGTEHSG